MKKMKHDCGPRFKPPTYVWEPRKENPKTCPRCKARLDSPKINSRR